MEEDGFKLVKSKKSSKKNKKSTKVVPTERIDEVLNAEEILQIVKYVLINLSNFTTY